MRVQTYLMLLICCTFHGDSAKARQSVDRIRNHQYRLRNVAGDAIIYARQCDKVLRKLTDQYACDIELPCGVSWN